jgi:FtsZ-interacting cell division protein ZipA
MMMDLQTSLIILGGVFVAGVITYNKWRAQGAQDRGARLFFVPR